jgi:hypothetical protein
MPSFIIRDSVEKTRDRFVLELVQRGPATVGKELSVAGFADARRRFVLAIQGWEHNLWVRPILTRLEGHFERSEDNTETRVVYEYRGLTLPLTFISLLIPYTVARFLLPRWEGIDPPLLDIVALVFSVLIVPVIGLGLYSIERRTHRLLERALLLIYDEPRLEDD